MHHNKAFTFIELLISMAIIAILASIAYPNYMRYIVKARRTDAQIALLDLAHRMEQHYNMHQTYKTANIDSADTPQHWYTLRIAEQSDISYTLLAEARQAKLDEQCQTLSLNHLGKKENEQCW